MVELPYENKVIFYMKLEKYKQRNPKKMGIAIFTIACVLLIAFVFIYSSFASFQTNETRNFINGNVVDPGDLYFAFYVDGEISNTMPAKGEGYVLDKEKTTCTYGATVEWLDDEWAPKINNLTQTRTKCTLYFKKYIPPATETILAQGETDELKFDNTIDNNLRYVGANPNNYVRFNNELWRIIGVFNNIDNGSGTKETRIKIIRNETIGYYCWDNKLSGIGSSHDSFGSSDWHDARLMMLLNPGYETPNSPIYEYEGSLYYNARSGTCYDMSTVSCDFTNTGLRSTEAKKMIGDAVWNLGELSETDDGELNSHVALASDWYKYERSDNGYSEATWTGKIALMYASDYGYATDGGSITNREKCLNTALYSWNSYDDCYENDWLYNPTINQWTLNPSSTAGYVVYTVYSNGNVEYNDTNPYGMYGATYVHPALYLNSNVKIVSGEGTESNPFVLSL